jgi:hypothetical protein
MSPGAGLGKTAAADATVKAVLSKLHLALGIYPPGSKKYKGLLSAIKNLADNFGEEESDSLIPMSVLQGARKGPGMQPQAPNVPAGIAQGAMSPSAMPPLPQGAM